MIYYTLKVLVSALIVVAVSELAKRSTFIGALVASLPLTSLLAFVWLYSETGDATRVANLSAGIFWLVLPSLALFVILPLLIRWGLGFWPGLAVAIAATAVCYGGLVVLLRRFSIEL